MKARSEVVIYKFTSPAPANRINPRQNLVEVAQRMLDMAIAGELTGLAYVAQTHTGTGRLAVAGDYLNDPRAALEAIEIARRDFLSSKSADQP
jgi:hypothetical protein